MTELQPPHAGPGWSDLARLDPLAAVIDPGDADGRKNRLINAVHMRALRRALGDVRGLRAIDFGCGTGRLSEWLVSRGATVVGVDGTPEMLEVARRRVPSAEFIYGGDGRLPLADASFDIAVTAYVLQYYVAGRADLTAILGELRRALIPGGRLVAIEQVATSDLGRGGTASAYREGLAAGGFEPEAVRPVRLGDSRLLEWGRRAPRSLRPEMVSPALRWEARMGHVAALRRGSYVDAVLIARARTA